MGKKMPVSIAIFLIACAAFISFQITYTHIEKKYADAVYEITSQASAFSKINAIDSIVRKNYIGEINEDELENGLIQGYLYGLGDKYATYMDTEEYASYVAKNNGKQVGIGITVIYDNTLGGMYITNVTKDSPAMQAGLAAGDIISAVDGQTVAERGYYNTISYIGSGNEGEALTLTVEKGPEYHQQVDIALVRAVVNTYTVSYEMYKDNVGYIEISGFNKVTPTEFIAAMTELKSKGAEAYIFDVRNNSGGDLEGIRGVLDYLLPEGPIIRVISKDGSEQVLSSDATCIEAPMAVLINGNTASAAELFSSALRDYGKAKLIGTRSYGKGTMQTMMRLTDNSALSISTQMYNPPYSENYEGIGLTPDIEIDLTAEQYSRYHLLELDEDTQVQAAYATLGFEAEIPEVEENAENADSDEDNENVENIGE